MGDLEVPAVNLSGCKIQSICSPWPLGWLADPWQTHLWINNSGTKSRPSSPDLERMDQRSLGKSCIAKSIHIIHLTIILHECCPSCFLSKNTSDILIQIFVHQYLRIMISNWISQIIITNPKFDPPQTLPRKKTPIRPSKNMPNK